MKNSNITDMTKGSPSAHILKFAWPLLIGNLFQQFYNMVDSIVVGKYVGKNALAAVGSCGSINFLFFSLSLGLSSGIGVIVAQYFGAKEDKKVRITIANAFYVLSFVSVLVTLMGVLLARPVLSLMSTPESVIGDASLYLRITCSGMLAIALYNGVSSILRALGDSRTPLYFLIFASLVNVGLDLLFVLVFNLGVFGVALATVISQLVSMVSSLIYALKKISYFKIEKDERTVNWGIVRKSFKLGVPIALQNSMIAVSCMILQRVVNTFGESVMAAFTIESRIEQLAQQPYQSLSAALITYSGQNMGAHNIDRVKQGFHRSIIMVALFSAFLIPVNLFGAKYFVMAFTSDPSVIEIGYKSTILICFFYFGLGMIYTPRATLTGCGDAGFAMINGISEVACRIIFSNLFTKIPALDFWGIWFANGCTWSVTALVCMIRYWTGDWKKLALVKKTA